MSQAWLTQSEGGSTASLRLIAWIGLNMGRPLARLLLWPVTLYFVLINRTSQRASFEFLARATNKPVSWFQMYWHHWTFAATILDRLYMLKGQHERLNITSHNEAAFHEVLARQKGFVLLGSHLGSFELLRSMGVMKYQLPVYILMYEAHAEKINSVMNAINPSFRPGIIPMGLPDTLIRVHEVLAQGAIVGILGDRIFDENQDSVACDFLGAPARFPLGPLLLAHLSHVPVVMFFGLYRGGNRYDVYFEHLADEITLNRKTRQAELAVWVQKYASTVAKYCRMAPYNWFNFYSYWQKETNDEQQ